MYCKLLHLRCVNLLISVYKCIRNKVCTSRNGFICVQHCDKMLHREIEIYEHQNFRLAFVVICRALFFPQSIFRGANLSPKAQLYCSFLSLFSTCHRACFCSIREGVALIFSLSQRLFGVSAYTDNFNPNVSIVPRMLNCIIR
jgi:hypothetical protein